MSRKKNLPIEIHCPFCDRKTPHSISIKETITVSDGEGRNKKIKGFSFDLTCNECSHTRFGRANLFDKKTND